MRCHDMERPSNPRPLGVLISTMKTHPFAFDVGSRYRGRRLGFATGGQAANGGAAGSIAQHTSVQLPRSWIARQTEFWKPRIAATIARKGISNPRTVILSTTIASTSIEVHLFLS